MIWSLIFTAFLISHRDAFGFAAVGAATSNYANAKSTSGLCTPDNEQELYYQVGLCKSLSEQINSGCTKDMIEEIRKELLGESKKKNEDGTPKTISMPSCEADPPKENKDMRHIAQNPAQFAYFMMNYMAMTIVKESNWDVANGESNGTNGPGGLLNLNMDGDKNTNMENSDYSCGCKDMVATTSGQSNVSFSGPSPGPLDGHASVTCGVTMAAKKILDDGAFDGGNRHDSLTADAQNRPRDARVGTSRLFASRQGYSSQDPQHEADDANVEWYWKKTAALCKRVWSSSSTDPWQRTLTDDIGGEQFGTKGSGNATQ